jgi:hypothetical protein
VQDFALKTSQFFSFFGLRYNHNIKVATKLLILNFFAFGFVSGFY